MKRPSIASLALLVALAALAHAGMAYAQWNTCGVPLAATPDDQNLPVVASDNAGGAITAWADHRNPKRWMIYAQRVNSQGITQWLAQGVQVAPDTALADTAAYQQNPAILGDGSGGAYIAWVDGREPLYSDIYLQHVSGSGVPLWATSDGGVGVCKVFNVQQNPVLVPDGAGGVIVVWQDCRNGVNFDIYAQRVDPSGALHWTAGGVALCTAGDSQLRPQAIPDGAGGAIVTWYDYRSVTPSSGSADIYARRINASGTPQWVANGVMLYDADIGEQVLPNITSDGAGGAIVAWQDSRNGNYDIYAQRIDGTGARLWDPTTATQVCGIQDQANPAPNGQYSPVLCTDGAGGAIIAWHDQRKGSNVDADIYAQRVGSGGATMWTTNGVGMCVEPGTPTYGRPQLYPGVVVDGSGGAIVYWYDERGTAPNLYAQRVDPTGLTLWTPNGVNICGIPYGQYAHDAVADGAGGAIMVWQDGRGNNTDVFTARVDTGGGLGAPSGQLGVDSGASGGLGMVALYPNPTVRDLSVRFVLPNGAPATLDLLDVTGRLIERHEVGSLGSGAHTLVLGRGARLRAGLYFVRLEQGGRMRLARASVTP